MKTRRIVVALIVLLALGAGVYVERDRIVAEIAKVMNKKAGPTAPVLYGNVDVRQVDLSFNVEGRVASMEVEEGDRVAPGQLLATLEQSRFLDAVDAAEAAVASRQAALDLLQAGSRKEEIARAKADMQAAKATLDETVATLKRQRALAQRNVSSQQLLDNAEAAEQTARSHLEAQRQTVALLVAGPRKEEIQQAKAQLRAAEADLALAQHRLGDTKLYAREFGIVLTRIQEPGAVILANSPIYSIALANPLWVRTYVSETQLGRIKPGMRCRITTDTHPDRPLEGWVGFISPTAEFTPKTVETTEIRTSLVYRVRVFVKDPEGRLRQGMPVTITLEEGTAPAGQPPDRTQ